MGDDELSWLHDRAAAHRSVLEVGCWKGRSTHALLSGCEGLVFAIDHFRGSPEERDGAHAEAKTADIFQAFWRNVGHFHNLVSVRGASAAIAAFFKPRSIEMVFIDAGHDYASIAEDLRLWMPIVSKLLCGHDREQDGVPQALNALAPKFKEGPGSLWYVEL